MQTPTGKLFALVLAAGLLGGCAAPGSSPDEWFEVTTSAFLRDESVTPEVEDALGWTLLGGVELGDRRLSVSPEVFASGSNHDVVGDAAAPMGEIDAFTYGAGLRLGHRFEGIPIGLHLRAGLFFRDERNLEGATVAEDQGGVYVGAGLEWWFEPHSAITLGVLRLHRDEDGLDETAVGIGARFSIGRSLDP